MAIRGITQKTLKNGEVAIYVRWKYKGKSKGVQNFTKLYGCNTPSKALETLNEIKIGLSKGIDITKKTKNLDYYFEENCRIKVLKKEWREDTTARNYKKYYEANIKEKIGWKKLSKITYDDLTEIINSLAHTKGTSRNTLKKILNPIMKEALKRNEITINEAAKLDHHKTYKREKLNKRIIETNIVVAQKLYKAIALYKPKATLKKELNAYLYLLIMTAHRYGELLKLNVNDIYLEDNLIISPAAITKTNEDYHYPIPNECIEYFKTVKSGKLFPNLRYSSMADYFKKLVELSEIKLFRNKTITAHDTRRLMLGIMIKYCKIDSMLADFCIDHQQTGVVEHYLDFTYEDKKEAFIKYWNIIREK